MVMIDDEESDDDANADEHDDGNDGCKLVTKTNFPKKKRKAPAQKLKLLSP